MSIIARLAGYEEYVRNDFKVYASDVDQYFEKYKEHPAVQYAIKIRTTRHVGFDAVMSMAVHLNIPPMLSARVPFTDKVPDSRWGKEGAEEFVVLLKRFYRETDSHRFFQSHADLYKTAEQRFQLLLNKVDFDWYRKFYGETPKGSFNLYIGLLNGGGNYGPRVVHPNGTEDLCAIIGTWQVDEAGQPVYSDENLPTIIHEYSHSFINHLIYANQEQLRLAGEKIFLPVAERMKRLAYGTWPVVLLESLVRAAVIRYQFEHEEQQKVVFTAIMYQRNRGFLWISELSSLLGVYESSRSAYPTFRSFFPLIMGYFNDLAKRIDFEAQRFDELLPGVLSMSPFANGAQDVDPNIKQMTFTFDRPLDPKRRHSFNDSRGREHYPIEKVVGFDDTGSTFTIQLNLKPDSDYEFIVTGLGFQTRDGYPLKSYTVRFKTKKLGM